MDVSVIVPVYNTQKYLRDCLDSLVKQSLNGLEIIVIDDDSTDNSWEIIKEYQAKYPTKIKAFQNERNLGQGATRNRGIKLAKGKYIGFVDSDDYVNFTMYQNMIEEAQANGYPEIITTGLYFVKDNSYLKEEFKGFKKSKGIVHKVLEEKDWVLDMSVSACNKLFRRDIVINDLFLEDRMWEDVAFSYGKMFRVERILDVKGIDYFYLKRETDGVSAKGFSLNKHLLDIFVVADKIEEEVKKYGKWEEMAQQVRFIQIVTSLQRVAEVLKWEIDDEKKKILVKALSQIIRSKYGDWRDIPKEKLSSRVGILELEALENIELEDKNIKEDWKIIEEILLK